ncbi:MAG TPA: C4-dicarboxylate ABC transporter permease [Ruminiclostridium sp.]|nr:C4-dicarboxylate ABC transporter permease [Ruminiclostridium sp.]
MSNLLIAISGVFTLYNILAILGGTIAGIIIGALPGLSSVMGLSILLPMTFTMEGLGGIMMLLGVFCGSIYGGSISAILINTPGTSASAATALDGYPMATKRNEPGRALGIATFASTFGGLFSCAALVIFSPLLAKVALQFSAPEYFALALFGISIITSISSKSIIKGLIGGVFGLLLGCIGIDKLTGVERFTFDSVYLMGGISYIPLLIGLFAFAQGLLNIEDAYGQVFQKINVKIKKSFPTKEDRKRIYPTVLRSSIIGTIIGAIPGTGGDIASWVCYNEARRWSKHKEEFGNGSPEGIAASESGNNAISGGALVPLLSLGIPGDAGTAVMLGSLMMLGIAPGPLLFTEHTTTVYMLFIGLFLANVFMGLLGFLGIKQFTKVLNVSNKILIPIIFTFCIVGSFSINNSINDVFFMMISGIIGYFLLKLDFSIPPIILGLILGSMAESNFRRSLVLSGGSFATFFERPISAIFILLALISLFSPLITSFWKKQKSKKKMCETAE